MKRLADLWEDPVVRHRLQVVVYALIHQDISKAARKFQHDRKTVRDYVRCYQAYQETGDLSVFLNRPRGRPQRTPAEVEEKVVAYYQEEDTQRSCPNIARVLAEEEGVFLTRQTVYNILVRRGVWVSPRKGEQPVRRFAQPQPNLLWQVDLIEEEETCLSKVYAVVVTDDHSRYLITLRFTLTKGQEEVFYALYQALCSHGVPTSLLVDRGSQFYSALEEGKGNRFAEIMERLGVEVVYTSRPQTKGKVEKLIQFIQRDFLKVERYRVKDLEDLNARAEAWRQWYNRRKHEGLGMEAPASRYRLSPCQVAEDLLWTLFAREERRKVHRDGTVRLWGGKYAVPETYVGWQVWVQVFAGKMRVCVGPDNKVIATYSVPT